jgi:hypothetical protein
MMMCLKLVAYFTRLALIKSMMFLAYRLTGLQAYRLTGLQAYRLTGLQAYRLTGLQVIKASHNLIFAGKHAGTW